MKDSPIRIERQEETSQVYLNRITNMNLANQCIICLENKPIRKLIMNEIHVSLDKQNYSQYHIIASLNKELILVLIDTGACNSHISIDLAQEIYESDDVSYETFNGEIVTNSKITHIELVLSKELRVSLEIPVDTRKKQENKKILLGIDFLEQFEYKITSKELILKNP